MLNIILNERSFFTFKTAGRQFELAGGVRIGRREKTTGHGTKNSAFRSPDFLRKSDSA